MKEHKNWMRSFIVWGIMAGISAFVIALIIYQFMPTTYIVD